MFYIHLIFNIFYIFVGFKTLACHSGEGGSCNRLALLLLRTAHATYLLTFPPEVPPTPSISCVLILVAALSLSTYAGICLYIRVAFFRTLIVTRTVTEAGINFGPKNFACAHP